MRAGEHDTQIRKTAHVFGDRGASRPLARRLISAPSGERFSQEAPHEKGVSAFRSMRHEDREIGVCENLASDIAKDELAQSAPRIAAFDEQVAPEHGRRLQKRRAG